MAESKAQTVKVIRESGESAAVVEDREQIPWSPKVDALEVEWKVMVFVPSEDPLVFVSVEQAGAWVEHDERARGLKRDFLDESTDEVGASETDSASIERDKEATERYLAFAEENGKPPNSTELFTLAHEKEIIRSLAFFENLGCTGLSRAGCRGDRVGWFPLFI